MTVVEIFIYEVCKYVFHNSGVLFLPPDHRYETRTKNNIRPSDVHSQFELKIKIYNKLPLDLRTMTEKKFLKSLTQILKDRCFYSIKEYLDEKL